MTWLLDLDGVVWRNHQAIPGSPEAVAMVQKAGHRVLYVTNNSALTAAGYVEKLAAIGISAIPQDVVHGGHAVARLVEPGERALLCAGQAVAEALTANGVICIPADELAGDEPPEVDVVVMGWLPEFDYRRLNLATRAVLHGARLIAPSSDPLYPTVGGVLMGGGALTAAVAYATKAQPVFAGKPWPAMTQVVNARLEELGVTRRDGQDNCEAGLAGLDGNTDCVAWMVGDQPSSDGKLAEQLGVQFALVHSGVTPVDHGPVDVPVALEAGDLATVVAQVCLPR